MVLFKKQKSSESVQQQIYKKDTEAQERYTDF